MRRSFLAAASIIALVACSSWAEAKGPAGAYYGRGTNNVFWFMHISDTHIGSSTVEDPQQQATPHLVFALNEAVPRILPSFVFATGDLCDASLGIVPTVGQQQDEWDTYKQIYKAANMKPDFYFDVPGNHDGYGEKNGLPFFLQNSLQGQKNGVPYVSWSVKVPDGEILFFGLNSAGSGVPQFSNPPGDYTDDELTYVEQTMEAHAKAELVVFGAHHELPGSTNLDRLQKSFTAAGGAYYLHGHRHNYSEYLDVNNTVVVNEINSLGKSDNDNIGIVVVDHKTLVYRALSTGKPWPSVVITAPVSATLRNGSPNPYAYKVCKDRKDNPIRALVFADAPITSVKAQVGPNSIAAMTAKDSSPLYEGELDTTALTVGPQEMTVTAKIGSEEVYQKLTAEFTAGPCDALPVDPGMGGSAGSAGAGGGAGGAGKAGSAGSAGGAGSAGKAGAGGGAGSAGSAGKGGSGGGLAGSGGASPGKGGAAGSSIPGGAGGDPAIPAEDTGESDGGCSCSSAGHAGSSTDLWAGLLAAAAIAVSRRRRQATRRT